MTHKISIDDFKDPTIFRHEIASSSGRYSRKSLAVISDVKTMKVTFEVTSGITKTTAYTLKDAITLYNDSP
jgi:hypothetical protein